MDSEKKLEEQLKKYQEMAKDNPNIDVNFLMANAIQNQKANSVSTKSKRWAYLISIGLPPFGLFFALKFFFGEEEDAKQTAWMCVILTALGILMFWFTTKLLISGSGLSTEQIQQINPQDLYELTQ